MLNVLKNIKNIINFFGIDVTKLEKDPIIDNDKVFLKIYKKCKPYTMTSKLKMYALYKSVIYILNKNIKGDFVECGV